mgnify:CR=1 FL=1
MNNSYGNYEASLNDMVDLYGAMKPFGVYCVMNHLKGQVWGQERQIQYHLNKRFNPQRNRLENLIKQSHGNEIDTVNIQRCMSYCNKIREEIGVIKMFEQIAKRVHDNAVDRFNNTPVDDYSERVFSFSKIDAPKHHGKVTRKDAATEAAKEFLAKTDNFEEEIEKNAKVKLELSEMAKMVIDQPTPDLVNEETVHSLEDGRNVTDDIEKQFSNHKNHTTEY